MPNRIIREGIISSDRVNSLSLGAEVLYRRLMSVADDYGRFYASPATIRGACWPTCPERVSEEEVGSWLDECSSGEEPLVRIYKIGNGRFLELTNFNQQIRSKSKFPGKDRDMLEDCSQPDINSPALDVVVGEGVCEDEGDDTGQKRKAAKPPSSSSRKKRGKKIDEASVYEESWAEAPWPSVRRFIWMHNTLTPPWWPMIKTLSDGRKQRIKEYLKQFPQEKWWQKVFRNIDRSGPWLRGYHNKGIDWLLQKGKNDGTENCAKVYDGKYLAQGGPG